MKSYFKIRVACPAVPLTSRLAPIVVLVVATCAPPENGSKLDISRNAPAWFSCDGLARYMAGPPSIRESVANTFTVPLPAS